MHCYVGGNTDVCLLNPLIGDGPLSSNTVIGTLQWPLMGGLLHLVQRGGA